LLADNKNIIVAARAPQQDPSEAPILRNSTQETIMDRRWIVTGGTRGIGLAVARLALSRGDRVAVLSRNPEAAITIADEAPPGAGAAGHLWSLRADVTEPDSIAAAVETIATAWGGVDVLVNNAGLHRGGKIDRLRLDDWNDVLAANLSGPLHCVRAVLPHMHTDGSIVNIGAVVGLRGFPGDSAYGASKAGLAGLTKVLAIELARRQVRVNLVVPGLVITEMTSELTASARDALIKRIPLNRIGAATEIAEVIYWVAGSTYMTGAVIPADGGLLCAF
jgi:NAD(P)-dependent dehydrogenase (short-subunit alcohol dehydrogenase family)